MRILTSLSSIHPSRLTLHLSGHTPWPLSLVVYGPEENGVPQCARYTPESDFFISAADIPRIIVEVHSKNVDDRTRLLAQGASLVRLVNTVKQTRTFVLLAVYFPERAPTFTEYVLYQDPNTTDNTVRNILPQLHAFCGKLRTFSQVYYDDKKFNNTRADRATFVLHLYNWAPSVGDDLPGMTIVSKKLTTILSSAKGLPGLTTQMKSKPSTSRSGGNNKRSRHEEQQGQQPAGDQLAAAGYQYIRSLGLVKAGKMVCVGCVTNMDAC